MEGSATDRSLTEIVNLGSFSIRLIADSEMLLRPRAAKWGMYKRHTVRFILGQRETSIVLDIELLTSVVFC